MMYKYRYHPVPRGTFVVTMANPHKQALSKTLADMKASTAKMY